MFASNQKLAISGCLEHDKELYQALEFALNFSNQLQYFSRDKNPAKCVYQITADGRYCIGWAFDKIADGWFEFPFDFDLEILSQIISKHLENQEIQRDIWAGSYVKGFLMEVIGEDLNHERNGIKNPFYGIVVFSPYTCFYGK